MAMNYLSPRNHAPRPLTDTEEFVMLLCQTAWEVGGNDSERLGKVRELLAAYGSNHPLPNIEREASR